MKGMLMSNIGLAVRQYGMVRVLRFLLADLRGRGLYNSQFQQTKSIFIHVPKIAGSSIAKALYGVEQGHYPCFLFEAISQRKFKESFKFGFVRNPWDRVVSAYHYLAQGGKIEADRTWARAHLAGVRDFSDFVRNRLICPLVRESIHFRSQTYFLCDHTGRIAVDFLGRFESLDRDFQVVADKVKPGARIRQSNSSSHNDFRTYYEADTRDLVGRIYGEEIAKFRYTFD